MNVRLLHLDGKLPNIALMRIAAHHLEQGDEVTLVRAESPAAVERGLFADPDLIYASSIFTRTLPVARRLKEVYPKAIVGGTGFDMSLTLADIGITTKKQHYGIYPKFKDSIGFTQRGCRLKCKFCVVPQKEGDVVAEQSIYQIWRGDPYPRNIMLLDNDFFGQEKWRDRIREIEVGKFKVCFSQGINARMLTDEAAEAIASIRYYDDSFTDRRIYTAWDNLGDEKRLFAGLNALVRYGVKPDQIMVYMLVGYWPGETHELREIRRRKLREFGCRPYPMPFVRTQELVAYQRWIVRRLDLKVSWEEFAKVNFQASNLKPEEHGSLFEVIP